MCLFVVLYACKDLTVEPDGGTLFELVEDSGVDFRNDLIPTEELNPYTYRNFYNGGGVTLGDINNDGLLDIYFTGNQVDNRLYLNKGNWKFEEITESAGVACSENWSTGATFVDINADDLLDLYVCKAGPPGGVNRNNQLFLNMGDLTFEDVSQEYGLDITGLSIHSAFFDFDKDGDLDCYLLSNSIRSVGNFDLVRDQRELPDPEGNKFLVNDDGKFRDATEELSIYSSKIGYGLGITLSDFNNDGWTDIFVSNDFFEKDYLYINNEGRGFQESGEAYFQCFSLGSMGADAADLNNDLLSDLFVTEMLPTDSDRKKTKMIYDSWDKYQSALGQGYYHQMPRNALQRNMGESGFLEISRVAGISGTDWSWASLLCDFDNDGKKDIFVSNGIGKDLLDRDYLAYMADGQVVRNMMKEEKVVMQKLVDIMPSERIPNVAYQNLGNFKFQKVSEDWGLDIPSFSNGSAYGDLDNDGDLDLVVSNVDDNAFVYKNLTDTTSKRYIAIELQGHGQNLRAIGSKVELYIGGQTLMQELFPSRGFQSSVGYQLHFGVGNALSIDSMIVYWPDGSKEKRINLQTNQTYNILQSNDVAKGNRNRSFAQNDILEEVRTFHPPMSVQSYSEFNKERLIQKTTSYRTPALAIADINNDGEDDLYYGGGYKQSSGLYVSSSSSGSINYVKQSFKKLNRETISEALWQDFDGDGDMDLYLGIGGRVFSQYSQEYDDYIFLNSGDNTFSDQPMRIKTDKPISTGAVALYNIDDDPSMEVILAPRVDIQSYGLPMSLLVYDRAEDETWQSLSDHLVSDLGMMTDMVIGDLDNDGTSELIVCGEWMPIRVFSIAGGKFEEKTDQYFTEDATGFWQTVKLVDIDGDGDLDLIAGNIGNNGFINFADRLYVSDFDSNGSLEQILCSKEDGKYYPKHDFDEIVTQLPNLRRQLSLYQDYANSSMADLFVTEVIERAIKFDIENTETTLWLNDGDSFTACPLPKEVQYSSVHAIETLDLNKDGISDILLGGNDYAIKPQYGRNDASKGWICYGGHDREGGYQVIEIESMNVDGEIRSIQKFNEDQIIIATGAMAVKQYKIKDEN